MKRLFAFAALLFLAAAPLFAQDVEKDVPERVKREIARRGDLVQRVDDLIHDDATEAICMALAPPADDSDKWFVTLVTQKGCAPCERLRADFADKPELQAWVDVRDYKKSWAHWQVIQSEDKTQAWRFTSAKPTSFPTLIISPPISGAFGDPKTVVFWHPGYDGKPAELANKMQATVKAYIAKVAPTPRNAEWRARQNAKLVQAEDSYGHGQQPPVPPISPLGPPSPSPLVVNIPPLIPAPAPAPAPSPSPNPLETIMPALLTLLTSVFPSAPTFLLIILVVLRAAEMVAKRTKTTLDDQVVDVLKRLAESANRPPVTGGP